MDKERVFEDREYRSEQIRKTEVQFFWGVTVGAPILLMLVLKVGDWMILAQSLTVILFVGFVGSAAVYSSLNPFRTYRSMWVLYLKGLRRTLGKEGSGPN